MKLLITADIHGNLSTWLTIQALVEHSDALVVAGDLFDTRYGSFCHPDFNPEAIRQDVKTAAKPMYYVYGNCDEPAFFPGQTHTLTFCANGRSLFVHHGFPRVPVPSDTDIVIQGHTHVWSLEKTETQIHMNPGSITRPKKGPATYGIFDETSVSIRSLDTGLPLMTVNL
jgi:hypothetical protein